MAAIVEQADSKASLSGVDVRIPLVVELDQSLILTDLWQESLAQLLLSDPLAALACLYPIVRGKAPFKATIAERSAPDAATLPYRESLLALLRAEKTRGREIHLIASTGKRNAESIAAHLKLFDSVLSGNDRQLLEGQRKLDFLRERFAGGFIYAGNRKADRLLFNGAKGAVVCDDGPGLSSAIVGEAPVFAELRNPRSAIMSWLRAFRVHQWSKNTLIFIPLFVGHAFGSMTNILHALAGFALACILASATYILNDIADLRGDRLHHTKRLRPLASGELSVSSVLPVAALMIVGTLTCAYLLAPSFAASVLLYLFLTLGYSFGLKRLPLLDVFVISSLFGLRIVMGTAVIGLGYSPWLLSFSWVFFLSLALAKRHVEVMRASKIDDEDVIGRGYVGADWPVTLSFGIGSGLISIVIMLLYLTNDAAPSGFYNAPKWLYFIPVLMTMWLMRIWLLSNRMVLHDDPVVFALRDPASLLLGFLTAAMFLLAL